MPRDSEVSGICRVPQPQSTPSSSQGEEDKAEREQRGDVFLAMLISPAPSLYRIQMVLSILNFFPSFIRHGPIRLHKGFIKQFW